MGTIHHDDDPSGSTMRMRAVGTATPGAAPGRRTPRRIGEGIRAGARRALALLTLASLVLPAGACGTAAASGSSTSTGTIRVAYLSTANYLTTVKDESFLSSTMSPYKAEFSGPYNPPDDAYKVVLAGRADTSSTGTGYFVDLISQKAPWIAYAIEYYDGDSQGIVAAPGNGVTSLKQLYGKRIGIDKKGATGDYIVKAAFEHAGLDYSKVTLVELSQTDFSAAFSSGKIDALATYDQNLASAIATPGARLLVTGKDYDSKNVTLHMVSKSFASAHPDIVRHLYRALKEESDKAAKNPGFIYDTYRDFGASESIIRQVRKFDVPTIMPLDSKGVDMLQDIADQYQSFGFIDKAPDMKAASLDCSD